METLIDIQGFQGATFIVKELAWITVDQEIEQISSTVFKPPYPWDSQSLHYQRINKAIIEACHKIYWAEGHTPYDKLNQVISKAFADRQFIYVKGLEKKRWLQNIVKSKTIIDLENLDCPPLKRRQDYNCHFCSNHEGNFYSCALDKVKKLKEWFIKNYCGKRMLETSLKLFCKLNIEDMRPDDLAMLPKHFIIACAANKINSIWAKLPADLQEDEDIMKYRRCNKHYQLTAMDFDDFSNDIPLVIDSKFSKKQ